ncbi:tetratricopeptide repeat protein [Arachidicoccus sp.]|uniref:tetratricopeptide repeat protein n=1 Tax=Arachidicoccus sp. TaxID=1872624 RepID=UPI003D240BB2
MKNFYILAVCLFYSLSALAQKGNKEVYYGNKAFEKGDYKTAISEYQKGLKIAPGNTTARINLAIAQSKLAQTDKSLANFDEAIKNSKSDQLKAELNYDKGVTFARSKKYEDAVKSFENTLRVTPEDQDARENLQKALNELKKQQQKQQPKDNKDKNKNQPPPPPKKKNQQEKQQQQQQEKMNKEQAEKLLQALRDQEKETQKKLQQKAGGQVTNNGKDW